MIPAPYDIIIIAKSENQKRPCGSNPAGLFLCPEGGITWDTDK
nr:MAG TPA: hypothetical protein [Caudoviricetes sp.]